MDTKTLLVLSDTHGSIRALEAVLKWANAAIGDGSAIGDDNGASCAAVFLGDGVLDPGRASAATGFSREWKIVRGNNDFDSSLPEATVFNFGGHRFFLCHGHRYALYDGCRALITAARKMKADAALFGHSHVPCFKKTNGLLLVNPGSVGRPRSKAGATFALINCAPGKPLEVEFRGLDSRGTVREITLTEDFMF